MVAQAAAEDGSADERGQTVMGEGRRRRGRDTPEVSREAKSESRTARTRWTRRRQRGRRRRDSCRREDRDRTMTAPRTEVGRREEDQRAVTDQDRWGTMDEMAACLKAVRTADWTLADGDTLISTGEEERGRARMRRENVALTQLAECLCMTMGWCGCREGQMVGGRSSRVRLGIGQQTSAGSVKSESSGREGVDK